MLNLHISLPALADVNFTNIQWIQLAFAILVGFRNTTAAAMPTKTASFLQMLMEIRQRVGELSSSKLDTNGHRDVFSGFVKRISQTEERLMNISNKHSIPTGDSEFNEGISTISSREVPVPPLGSDLAVPMPELFQFSEMDYQFMQDYTLDPSVEEMMDNWF